MLKKQRKTEIKNYQTGLLCLISLCGLCGAVFAGTESVEQMQEERFLALSEKEISMLALQNSIDIQLAKFDAYIKRAGLERAESVFDTVLNAGISYSDDQKKQASTILGTKAAQMDYQLGIEKQFSSGTTLGVDVEDKRIFTNSAFSSLSPYHEAAAKISLHQPIGNNFFGLIGRGQVKITAKEISNSDALALDRIEEFLAQTQSAYWELSLKYAQLQIQNDMMLKAKELYEAFKQRYQLGTAEEAELFASQANFEQRKADVLIYEHAVKEANNNLLLALHEEDLSLKIMPQQLEYAAEQKLLLKDCLRMAIAGRRDYQRLKNDIFIRKLDLRIKENSLWPQIDLEASFLHNGLAAAQGDAWKDITEEDNPQWYAGINFNYSLENRAAKSNLKASEMEKAKTLLNFKKKEHEIFVQITNSLDALQSRQESAAQKIKIVELQDKKLKLEEERFSFGRSNTDILIRYQEDLLLAKLALFKALFDLKLARINLRQAENSLLHEYWQGEL